MGWENDPADIEAWQKGLTGYPFIDAGMRQLASTGWMHNRVRMVVASFLVKDLLVDWRIGERWFRRLLVDGDVAQNARQLAVGGRNGSRCRAVLPSLQSGRQSQNSTPTGRYIRPSSPNSPTSRPGGSTALDGTT